MSRWVALAAICIAAAGFGVVFRHQIAEQIALAVTTQSTPFTELHFSDPSSLPTSLSLSRPNPFAFTIVNREGHDASYWYAVTLASSHGVSTIAESRIDVRDKATATRLVNVRPTHRDTEYLITVTLRGRTERIWFRGTSR